MFSSGVRGDLSGSDPNLETLMIDVRVRTNGMLGHEDEYLTGRYR
jgi:hypothetical protein